MRNIAKKSGKRMLTVMSIFAASMILQGCVVFLSSVATVVMMRGDKHHTTTVLVKKDPTTVYAAMIRIIERRSDIKILSKEDEKHFIEVSRGDARATAKATDYGSGLTQLMVTADAGKSDQTDEALALNVVTQVCDELGVAYKLI